MCSYMAFAASSNSFLYHKTRGDKHEWNEMTTRKMETLRDRKIHTVEKWKKYI